MTVVAANQGNDKDAEEPEEEPETDQTLDPMEEIGK